MRRISEKTCQNFGRGENTRNIMDRVWGASHRNGPTRRMGMCFRRFYRCLMIYKFDIICISQLIKRCFVMGYHTRGTTVSRP